MSYNKKVRGENISADEIGAHNHIQIFNDGSGKLIVCFLILLFIAMIVYLWIAFHLLLIILMFGAVVALCIIGGSTAWRHVSNTVKIHKTNQAEIEWSRLVYRTENLIATLNRSTREISVHNAQEVSIQHHHAAAPVQISEVAQSKSYMPKLSDLSKDNQA
jgi:hypothetical protein